MANKEHLDIVRNRVDTWYAWRSGNQDVLPDLSDADLTKATVFAATLAEADLIGANLRGAYLIRANLRGPNLSRAYYSNKTEWLAGFAPPQAAVKVPD